MHISLKNRLILGFGLILSLMIIVTVIGIDKVNQINSNIAVINDVNSVKQRYAINFRGSVHDRAIAVRDVVLVETKAELDANIRLIRDLEDFYSSSAGPLDSLIQQGSSATEKSILAGIKNVEKDTLPLVELVIDAVKADEPERAKKILLEQARPAFVEWLGVINEFIDYQEAQNVLVTQNVRETATGFTGFMILITSVSMVLSLVVVWFIIFNLTKALGGEPDYIARVIEKMASGDLNQRIKTKHEKSVLDSINKMQEKLRTTIASITATADSIEQHTNTSSEGSSDLLSLSSSQAQYSETANNNLESVKLEAERVASLLTVTEETSNTTVKVTHEGGVAVNEAAKKIRDIFAKVSEAVENIRKLEQRTQEISGITGTISSISEQTNLLALNAAIEAARAGETGRGFAVVADEVRTLAQRTGEATSVIEKMLSEVQNETGLTMDAMSTCMPQIEEGLTLSERSSELLKEIEHQAADSSKNVNQVISASKHQIDVLSQLNNSMAEVINSSVQMGAVSNQFYETNQSIAEKLKNLATSLSQQASYFRI
jgi:methyl-accepting chemotaxis protein